MRVAAVWVPDFPLQALRRAMPELAETPLAIAAGPSPRDQVVAVSAEAAELGVRVGMTAAQARQRSLHVTVRVTPPEVMVAAEAALGDAARAISPRVRRHAPGEVVLDVGGLLLRWGSEAALAEALWRTCRRLGLDVCIGVASTVGVARIAARQQGGRWSVLGGRRKDEARVEGASVLDLPITAHSSRGWVVVPEGTERAFLAPLPVRLLEPSPLAAAALQRWGIDTAGALAALPRREVVLRLGPEGEALHRLACGDDGHAFIPDPAVESVREGVSFDEPMCALEPFLFVLNGVLGRLAQRLQLRGEGFAEVRLELALEGGERRLEVVRLIAPTGEVAAVLPLLRLRLEAAPPGAPVEGVTVVVHPGVVRLVQGDLFGPPLPAPGKLAATLVRLAALVGPERVGAPGVADTHEPGRWLVLPFEPPPWETSSSARARKKGEGQRGGGNQRVPPILRAVRPPLPAQVVLAGRRPVAVHAGRFDGVVVAVAGPYRTSGEWWRERSFSREDYDVALADGSLLRLFFDRLARRWAVDGVYD